MSGITSVTTLPVQLQATKLTPAAAAPSGGASFGDIIDAINPLQHIPVLSGLMRAATGGEISTGAKIIGDTLYGGIFGIGSAISGLVSSAADAVVKEASGQGITEHVLGALGIADTAPAQENAVPLVATNLGVSYPLATDSATILNGKVNMALNAIYHVDPAQATHQYERAQVAAALQKQLIRMAV